jgi:uncharacterized protein YejL (UPF0352 family)
MKKLFLLCVISLLTGCVGAAMAQEPLTANGAASDATNAKIHQLDLLIKLVPLALQKDQFPALFVGLDKAIAYEKVEAEREDKLLADLDPDVTAAVDDAVQKGIYPKRELQEKVQKALSDTDKKLVLIDANMVILVYNAIQSGLNAGQRKAMAGSFSAAFIDSTVKPEDITDEVKIRYFIRRILLDPAAYKLLKEMEKHAS